MCFAYFLMEKVDVAEKEYNLTEFSTDYFVDRYNFDENGMGVP